MNPSIQAIVPAYNEAATVAEVVRLVKSYGCEVIVVSDGSSDGTAAVAKAAGATVLVLPQNIGKGGALRAGLELASSEFVMMLDADLTGGTPQHLADLARPVLAGELDMSIGVFEGGKFMSEWGNRLTPQLSGQRVCRREWLLGVPRLGEERWPEPAITEHIEKTGIRWDYVVLPNMGQVLKEQKRGLVKGVLHRVSMYADLLTYRLRKGK